MTSKTTKPLVLVIEDEEPIRRFLRASLVSNGFQIAEAGTAHDGVIQAGMKPPDVIILDLGLPDADGLEVTRKIREWSKVPIVVLSARGQEQDKIDALDQGADDYLTKPFGVGELIARLRVALRHAAVGTGDAAGDYQCARDGRTIKISAAKRVVTVRDGDAAATERVVRLTPTEFKFVALLAKHAGKVLTHKQILTEVWGPSHAADVQYLRVYAGQLRQKLEADPTQPRFLITEPGVGYRFSEGSINA